MEYGHIVISSNMEDWISQVIKIITESYFSHSFITAPPICNRLMCLEASGEGVTAIPFDIGYKNDDTEDYIIFSVNVSDEIRLEAISKSMDDLQKSYGYFELPWFAWRALCSKFGIDIKHKDNWSQAGIICSEFASNYLRYCGLDSLFYGFGNGSINAEDLYRICKNHPELFTEVERKIRNLNDPTL